MDATCLCFFPMDATEVCQFQLWKSKQMVAWKWWNHVMTSHPSSFGNRAGSFGCFSKCGKTILGWLISELGSTKKKQGLLSLEYLREPIIGNAFLEVNRRPSNVSHPNNKGIESGVYTVLDRPPLFQEHDRARSDPEISWSGQHVWRASTTLPRPGEGEEDAPVPSHKGWFLGPSPESWFSGKVP